MNSDMESLKLCYLEFIEWVAIETIAHYRQTYGATGTP